MDHMMMETGLPMVWGFNLSVLLMLLSGVFYIICAMFIWKPYKQEKNELIGALLAFLIYQAINMFFMGLEMHTMNMVYSNIAALAVLLGSTYMLRFPFSSYSEKTRRTLFTISLVVVLGIYAWFMQSPERETMLMSFILWYDIIVNGIVVGGFIIGLGLMATDRWYKVKAIGGGSGVVSCCVVSSGAMLGGAILTSSVFGFLAPILILGSLGFARRKQQTTNA